MAKVTVTARTKKIVTDAVIAKLEKLGKDMVRDAQHLVPVDTGALKDTIRYRVDKTNGVIQIMAGGINGVDYAGYVEYGTRHMAAQPYLRPAMYKKRGKI